MKSRQETKKRRYAMTSRAAKADATKAGIRLAAIALYRERPVEDFTLEEVAARAGVAVRTILRAYPSKDELVYAALADMAAGGVFLKPSPPGDVKAAVTAFFDIYEGVGDLVMQWLNDERRHPGLKPTLEQGRDNHRDGVKTVFAPQLERTQGAARKELLDYPHHPDRRLCLEASSPRHGAQPFGGRGNGSQDDCRCAGKGDDRWLGFSG